MSVLKRNILFLLVSQGATWLVTIFLLILGPRKLGSDGFGRAVRLGLRGFLQPHRLPRHLSVHRQAHCPRPGRARSARHLGVAAEDGDGRRARRARARHGLAARVRRRGADADRDRPRRHDVELAQRDGARRPCRPRADRRLGCVADGAGVRRVHPGHRGAAHHQIVMRVPRVLLAGPGGAAGRQLPHVAASSASCRSPQSGHLEGAHRRRHPDVRARRPQPAVQHHRHPDR